MVLQSRATFWSSRWHYGAATIVLMLTANISQPAVVENLYTVTVERDLSAEDPRAEIIRRAMTAVLVRVTGAQSAAVAPELASLLAGAETYVSSIGNVNATQARVSFLPNEVNRALLAANWPIWGAERPQTVFWIAVADQFGQRAILSSGELDTGYEHSAHMGELLSNLREEIVAATLRRGLPRVLPRLDARDLAAVDVEDLWAYDFDAVARGSVGYVADALVIGRVRESPIGTDVEWLLQIGGERRSLPGAGFNEGVDWLADTFATQFRSSGGERDLFLRVSNVNNFEAYARVVSFLESVSMLSSVEVDSFSGQDLILRVRSRGDAQVLGRTLALGNVLRLTSGGVGSTGLTNFSEQGNIITLEFTVVTNMMPPASLNR